MPITDSGHADQYANWDHLNCGRRRWIILNRWGTHAKAAGLCWPLPEGLSAEELDDLLFPQRGPTSGRNIPQPDWAEVHKELRRKSVTLSLLWVEYRQEHPDGYGYSQFCHHYRTWAKQLKPMMRQKHKAGEKLFVDYAGQTAPVVDPETGEIWQAEIFVAVLGASNYTYAEAHRSQSLPNWIGAHVRALAFLGGRPEVLVPDNLKAGVKSPHLYEPDLNPTYLDFAQHYGLAVVPARVRKPKDKAKVEVGVQVVERWILARLRNHTFFSLAELNQAIKVRLDELNNRLMRHLGHSRRELFTTLDKPVLAPLPTQPYEFARWKKARVWISGLPRKQLRFSTNASGELPTVGPKTQAVIPLKKNTCQPLIKSTVIGHRSVFCAGQRKLAQTPPGSLPLC